MGDKPNTAARDALAESWASMDGQLTLYEAGKTDDGDGYFEGYTAEAEEMMRRLWGRGFCIVKIPSEGE